MLHLHLHLLLRGRPLPAFCTIASQVDEEMRVLLANLKALVAAEAAAKAGKKAKKTGKKGDKKEKGAKEGKAKKGKGDGDDKAKKGGKKKGKDPTVSSMRTTLCDVMLLACADVCMHAARALHAHSHTCSTHTHTRNTHVHGAMHALSPTLLSLACVRAGRPLHGVAVCRARLQRRAGAATARGAGRLPGRAQPAGRDAGACGRHPGRLARAGHAPALRTMTTG